MKFSSVRLVFTQYLDTIALIKRMLEYLAENNQWFVDGHEARLGEQWSWTMGKDYDIIDGDVSLNNRDKIQKNFNDPWNQRFILNFICV